MIIPLAEATTQSAGPKAAVLGRLLRAGFPVPPGFVIPVAAYRAITTHLDLADPAEARRVVEAQPVPPWLLAELAEALAELGDHPVAVRSSATTEDTPTTSAAGQHDTFLGVHGLPAIAAHIRTIWGSLWSHRAIAYRRTHPAALTDPGIAIIVQRHVDADVAGVLFTADPRTASSTAVIEASWGLGESVVQGSVDPDTYTLAATADSGITRRAGAKRTRVDRITASTHSTTNVHLVTTEVAPRQQQQFCLTDSQVRQVVDLGQQVADYLGAPQDVEFAIEDNHIWLLQARPITAPLDTRSEDGVLPSEAVRGVLQGVGGSAGVAVGPARVVVGVEDFGRVRAGDILVCRFTDPAWTPLFGVVAGVVTEVGGRLSHAAIVAREHRIPAVLGVAGVMDALVDGQSVTIVGSTGVVTPGPIGGRG